MLHIENSTKFQSPNYISYYYLYTNDETKRNHQMNFFHLVALTSMPTLISIHLENSPLIIAPLEFNYINSIGTFNVDLFVSRFQPSRFNLSSGDI